MRKLLMTFTMCGLCYVAAAQQEVNAVKTLHAPVIDGNLDDVAWKTAPVLSGFIQNLPTFGAPSSAPTEVKVLYDNDAIYIAAFLYDEPSLVRNQLTARDAEKGQNADYFSVFFDTYNDQQNGFQFLVTPANVQSDTKLNPGAAYTSGEFGDRTWDAVWQSRTQLTSKGWQVEMRIPYLSLRFAKKDIQTWGIQFLRFIRRNNESAYWNATNPNINGFINQFGRLVNLEHIRPPLRLSFSPYVSGGVRFNPSGSDREKEVLRNGGMDVKYGLNESFTLDVTLIPDFGQVVSDNVINNLSPFEIRFQENRPFFSEGTELFNKAGLFYSRRVGATPMYYDSVRRFADNNPGYLLHRNPSVVQLYNGLKFSGRTRNKLGIGIFNAVTAPAKAKLQEIVGRNDTTIETEPLTNYNIIVLDQALKGRSSVTFTNTSVMRNASARDANVSALDWSLYTSESQYRVNGTFRYSKIFGYTPYNGSVNFIDDTITRYGKLYVKPYDGFSTILRFGKVSGRIQFSGSAAVESDTYDPNDLGFIPVSNEVVYNASVSYNDFTPGRSFLNYRHSLNSRYTRLYRPDAFSQVEFWYTGSWYLRNFWEFTFNAGVQPVAQHDYFELRTPKRYLERPGFFYLSAIGNTDIRKKLFISYQLGYTNSDIANGNYFLTGGAVRYRFSNRFTLSADVVRQHDDNQIGYAFFREPGGEPVIGYRKNTEVTAVLTGIYNFTPRMNLNLRGRHYWNKVNYRSFFTVSATGDHIPRTGPAPDQDYNFNLFNVDAFITWDFRLGSRLIFGWKNWLADSYGTDISHRTFGENFSHVFGLNHGNEFTLKLIYFIDYNQLARSSR